MAAEGPLQDLCNEATCPICLDYFTDPVTIVGCGHNFCQACLNTYWGKGRTKTSCPQCRGTVRQRNYIPNRQLRNVVEITKKLHGQKRAREAEAVCQKHQETWKLFCRDHQAPICVVCDRSKEHEGHKVIPLEEAFQEYKDQISGSLKILTANRQRTRIHETEAICESWDLLEQVKKERENSMAAFRQIHQFLEEQEKNLLAQIDEMEKEIVRRRDEHLARVSVQLSSLENLIQEMEEKSQQPANEFLQDIGKTWQKYEKLEVFENAVAFPPELTCKIRGFCDVKSLLEGIMKQFEDPGGSSSTSGKALAFLHSQSDVYDCSGVCQSCPSAEVDKSSKVLSNVWASAANVTLDPDTAHPQLILSEDYKSVKMESSYQALPSYPERFDKHAFVLGREGFTAGRHFWEVTVGSEEPWAVGVARKSVRRKDTFDLSPEEGFWAVGKWGGYRVFNAPDYTALPLRQELKSIRVILNCVEGEVAFSDSDTGDHIHTYSGVQFCGEIVLPFFYVFGKAHLRLSP